MTAADTLLSVKGLTKHFTLHGDIYSKLAGEKTQVLKAVDGIDFHIRRGETLGLVGESGCGKSTTARLVTRLIEPTAGEVTLKGEDLLAFSRGRMKEARKEVQLVFQDPYSSLNPRKTIMHILDPELVIGDEPVSALDVSIQAQILNLFRELQKEFGLTYLFIAHDLSVIRHISDRVAVMYVGKIVETGPAAALFDEPLHPYTKALLAAVPEADPTKPAPRLTLQGEVSTPIDPPPGCRLCGRCPRESAVCAEIAPPLVDVGDGRQVACHNL
ncbi:MAG: ATP-binding cassette domain-containing protein [Chloroflexi bacterium]|nr:ATP-binding cassette domain-containing protein [Chloroflexota bacterium]